MKFMILGAALFGLGSGAAYAAPGGVSFPAPTSGGYDYLGTGNVSVTYDDVTFTQSASYGSADLYLIGSQLSGGFPPVLSSQGYLGGVSNILITLPAMVQSLTIWFGTYSSADVTFTLSNGQSSTLASAGTGYISLRTFTASGRFNSVLLTSSTMALNIGSLSYDTAAAPEPASWMLMIGGFGAIGGAMRRRRVAVRFG